MNKQQFGNWIKGLRIECNYTQYKLSELLQLNHSQSIANIESGRVMLPRKCYKQFIQIFRLDANQFIELVMKVHKNDLEDYIFSRKSNKS